MICTDCTWKTLLIMHFPISSLRINAKLCSRLDAERTTAMGSVTLSKSGGKFYDTAVLGNMQIVLVHLKVLVYSILDFSE